MGLRRRHGLWLPVIAGALAAILSTVLITIDLALRQQNVGPDSIGWGLMIVGPPVALVLVPTFVVIGLVATGVAFASGIGRPGLIFGAVFFVLCAGALVAGVWAMAPFLLWPSTAAATILIAVIAVAAAVVTFPRSERLQMRVP